MGYMPEQQIVVQTATETSKWWVPILCAVITGIFSLIVLYFTGGKKK